VSISRIPAALRRLVIDRAGQKCEYRWLSSEFRLFPHEVDHIVAEKHGGKTIAENLALTCWRCNRHKGSDVGSFDPLTGEFVFLFNPRQQDWSEHFLWHGIEIRSKTPEGRVTVRLLQLNSPKRLIERSD
jgi:5-methylcytosine-specific restriction endonuclease McrA